MPPMPHHIEVVNSTKPANDDAYGEGTNTQSRTKSKALPCFVFAHALYFVLFRINLRMPQHEPNARPGRIAGIWQLWAR